jgi:hypothetical protein
MAVVARSSRKQANGVAAFRTFEQKVQAMRQEWQQLCERYGVHEWRQERGDAGFSEAGCAVWEAQEDLKDE